MGRAHHGHAGWEFAWLECQEAWQRESGQKISLNTSAQCLPCAAPWGALHPHFPGSTLYPSLHSWHQGGDAELHLPVSSCPLISIWRVQTTAFSWGDASWLPSAEWEISYGPSALTLDYSASNGCGKGPALGTGPDGLTLRNRGCHYTSGETGNSRGPRALRQPPTRKAEACEVLGASHTRSHWTAHPTRAPWDLV